MILKKEFQQFVPQETCLSCDGCCRFKEQDSEWRPKVGKEEIEPAQQTLPEKILLKDKIDSSGHIKTMSVNGQCACSFFNPEDNTCRIYSGRPFDCQLYPFILVREEDRISVCVHLNCPFIQKQHKSRDFFEYIDYLHDYFSSEAVLSFLKNNPDLAGDYKDYRNELKHIFFLNI